MLVGHIRKIKGKPEYIPRVKDMRLGETGYIVPWAIDYENKLIRLDSSYSFTKGGTDIVKITRISYSEFDIEYP